MNSIIGYMILTYRPSQAWWEPFCRTTTPLVTMSLEAATKELEQVKLNYPGHRFMLSTVIADLSQTS